MSRLRQLIEEGKKDSEEARDLAREEFDHKLPSHNCYWNDRFCIAHQFDLDKKRKREAAIWVHANGQSGYYETITHYGFNLNQILIDHGIPEENLPSTEEKRMYDYLSSEALELFEQIFLSD